MRVHHLNCISTCPAGGHLMDGRTPGVLERGHLCCHCLLLETAHGLGIRVVLDLVMNHTSDEHPWFVASRQRQDPYTDWYLWRDGRGTDRRACTSRAAIR